LSYEYVAPHLPISQLIEPSRFFIREGDLQKVCRKDRKKRHFFLFNDILLYGQDQPGNKFVFLLFDSNLLVLKDSFFTSLLLQI